MQYSRVCYLGKGIILVLQEFGRVKGTVAWDFYILVFAFQAPEF